MKKILLFGLMLGALYACQKGPQGMRVEHLTCGYAVDPLGIDDDAPLLGWRIASTESGAVQSAYSVLVASTPEKLDKEEGDLWESGMVRSGRSQQVRYRGTALQSGQECYWKVRVWDAQGRASAWSAPAQWSMGLLKAEAWAGTWISDRYAPVSDKREMIPSWPEKDDYRPTDTAAVYLRKTASLSGGIARATAYISGLGYYELYLNGSKVGTAVMDPLFSDYQRSVYYTTYDVTRLLKRGENALGILLGNGFYNLPARDLFQFEKANWKTPPKVLMNLVIEYASGETQVIATDASWRWSTGEIAYNCIRGGETIDHTKTQQGWNELAFDDSAWAPAVEVPAPLGTLRAEGMPPMRVNEVIAPVAITEPREGVYLVDFGKNLTGWIALNASEARGREVICDYNESLLPDGTLDTIHSRTHTGGRFQQERFIFAGGGEEHFEPRFTYHGFRYAQLRGLSGLPLLSKVTAKAVYTALDTTGRFWCSDLDFNNLHKAVERTLLNSAHGMTAEEPTREKMGWTLDAGVASQSYLYHFDAVNALRKNLQDFIDAQESSGHIASIVPTNGWAYTYPDGKPMFWDDPWWGGSIFLLADNLYTFTGDTSIIAHAFEPMRRYADYVATTAKKDLVYWSLGDWLDMNHHGNLPGLTPVVQTATAGYYWFNERIAAYARMLGKEELAGVYATHADRIKKSFNAAFLDRKTGWYQRGSQTAQALPLFLGMVPDEMHDLVESRLIEALTDNGGHITTGFIGSIPLLEYLPQAGYMDLAYAMVAQRGSPGWLHMVADENSTMAEDLFADRYGSGHHPYGAHIGFWLYKYLGGIRPDREHPGFKTFFMEPYFPADMDTLRVATQSLYGKIALGWKKTEGGITLTVEVPGNSSARLILPAAYRVGSIPRGTGAVPGPVAMEPIPGGRQQLTLFAGAHRFILSQ